ncbi:hypothetical protein ACH4TC_18590 [Streptomyces spororaveus]|uniref:hypothetical protein n=1 Tax=Streptomyces spororaveus TaxID=284039 RepID=UPI0037994779
MTTVAEPTPAPAVPAQRPLDDLIRMADLLGGATVLPTHMIGNRANILVHLLAGQSLGLGEFAALYELYPSATGLGMKATLARTLCNTTPGYKFDLIESTDTVCTVEVTTPDHGPREYTYDLDMADTAGLRNPDRESAVWWVAHPKQMLLARASMNAVTAFAPELLAGVRVLDETETGLPPLAPREPEPKATAGSASARPASRSETASEPPAETEPEPDQEPEKPARTTAAKKPTRKAATVKLNAPAEPTPEEKATALWEEYAQADDLGTLTVALTRAARERLSDVMVDGMSLHDRLSLRANQIQAERKAKQEREAAAAKAEVADEDEGEDSPEKQARALLALAETAEKPGAVGGLYADAGNNKLLEVDIDGQTLREHLAAIVARLRRPEPAPAPTLPEPGECTCPGDVLLAGEHEGDCPETDQ